MCCRDRTVVFLPAHIWSRQHVLALLQHKKWFVLDLSQFPQPASDVWAVQSGRWGLWGDCMKQNRHILEEVSASYWKSLICDRLQESQLMSNSSVRWDLLKLWEDMYTYSSIFRVLSILLIHFELFTVLTCSRAFYFIYSHRKWLLCVLNIYVNCFKVKKGFPLTLRQQLVCSHRTPQYHNTDLFCREQNLGCSSRDFWGQTPTTDCVRPYTNHWPTTQLWLICEQLMWLLHMTRHNKAKIPVVRFLKFHIYEGLAIMLLRFDMDLLNPVRRVLWGLIPVKCLKCWPLTSLFELSKIVLQSASHYNIKLN